MEILARRARARATKKQVLFYFAKKRGAVSRTFLKIHYAILMRFAARFELILGIELPSVGE